MLRRWLGLPALAAVVLGVAACGGGSVSDVAEATGDQLTVYSSLPLQGPAAGISEQIVNGEKLALLDAGGRAGRFKIDFSSLDDASPTSGQWNPGLAATNAKIAAQDTSTIAYLGDLDSAATAISLPFMNAAGILQISPGSPYVGLTSSLDAGEDEPERFYPSGKRTFVRLQPSDILEAEVQVELMRSLGVERLYVLDDQEPFEEPLATLVIADAEKQGITVLAHDSVSMRAGSAFRGEARKVAASGAQAVFVAGCEATGAVALWRALHRAAPSLLLLGSSSARAETFASHIGAAARETYLSTPVLPTAFYPPSARTVLKRYRTTFGSQSGPYVLYGYEAMTLVLDAIESAGPHGDDRQSVIDNVFATRDRDSVLGRYSFESNGESTLARYAVDRVVDGRLVFDRTLAATAP